ncbi:MAG TPA: glycosyltransferase [Acidimicrobiales bacterium]|nr:glycosyltransferase [Acidimicrobiales bacterium]
MVAVHQFIPTFAPRDAIGTHALHAQRILRDMGIDSDIYAGGSRGARPGQVHSLRSFARRAARSAEGTWLLYQLSTGSAVFDFLMERPEPKLVNYHNITDPSLYRAWEPGVAVELGEGRRQLRELAPRVELGIAVSEFNRADLEEAGYARTTVAPVLVDLEEGRVSPDPATSRALAKAKSGGGADWLFVGRLAPHKCQHDVVRAFAAYRAAYDPRARLHLVGGTGSHAYRVTLERYLAGLGLAGAVTIAGSVRQSVLAAVYRNADVFVCLSEHEGFCVPIVEAMRERVPVVAFAATAVPETVAGAAVLLPTKDPMTVAAAVSRVLGDEVLRKQLADAGEERASHFTLERAGRRFRTVMEDLLQGAEAGCA